MEEINKFKVYSQGKGRLARLYTKSMLKNASHFGEKIFKYKSEEYREIDPKRSKFAAAIIKGLSQTGIKPESKILYLGASHGYTPSFVSDIVGENGVVFCLDFAPTVMRDLVLLCERRKNMIPLIADAKKPSSYKENIIPVDVVYQDIAQREQVKIFVENCDLHLKDGGFGLLALKSRSVDVSEKPKRIFELAKKELEKHLKIVDYRELDPYEKDHAFFVVKK